jgi:hypothetical protein
MDICRRTFGACLLGGLSGLTSRTFALPARPKLLVLVILQQFRPDYLDAGWPKFGSRGFRRLISNGAWFPDCRHIASTFSATALATLATGGWPAQHGIVADSWYDRGARQTVAASDEALQATTLAAQVAAAERTRVFVVSGPQIHGRLFAGTAGAQIFWMDSAGEFTSGGEPPAWLAPYNKLRPLENLHNAEWTAVGAGPGAPPLRTLKYDAAHPEQFLELYSSSPFGQEAQFGLLGEMIAREHLGQTSAFDFVVLLEAATGLLGYETGADSPLMQQMTLQTDRNLESLLDQLDRSAGEDSYNLVLTAAHGAPPAPSAASRARMAVNGETVAQAVARSLSSSGNGKVEKYVYPFLYLDSSGSRGVETARLAAGRAALGISAVAAYYTADGACSTRTRWERSFRNSFHPIRSGDLMLAYQPEYVEDYGAGRGVSYGSLYNYDVQTPLCFFGPQFRAGTHEEPVEAIDVAPTLARAMGVAAPSSSIGRVLGEAFAETVESKK